MPARDVGQDRSIGTDDTAHEFEEVLREAARISDHFSHFPRARLEVGRALAGGRLQVLRPLSRGGSGAVFVVRDEVRGEQLALKLLICADAASVYRLKNEFRTLSEIVHPNVVRLYELFAEDDLWFFTMELVDGTPFHEWVRPTGVLDEARLCSATSQLLQGIGAIHDAGKLHRDLKPENVLVTKQGRVVVIDLGLAIDPREGGVGHTVTEHYISGTPAYMSPEQAAGTDLSTASDYYAIGVMLYEALTGLLPFTGSAVSVLAAKQHAPAPNVPAQRSERLQSLARLVDALLSPDPQRRPDRSAIVAALATMGIVIPPDEPRARGDGADGALFCGREAELSALRRALVDSLSGQCVIVAIEGESGIGKSALCEAFARLAQREYGAVILAARCFEHESLPYKALDPLIDAITRHLRRLPESEAAVLLPRDAFALARLIPTFARAEVVRRAPARPTSDPEELQQRAFDALAELLARIRDRTPVVVHIDDLQWSDDDSLACVRQLLVQRQPAPLLMILAQRSSTPGDGDSPIAQLLAKSEENPSYSVRRLPLRGLPIAHATRLALTLLAERDDILARDCAEEAHGNPFVLAQLCLLARTAPDDASRASVTELVTQRLAPLNDEAHVLLEIVALAGRPIPAAIAVSAACATYADLRLLQAARLVQSMPGTKAESCGLIACYHDRIRESVVASIPAHAQPVRWARLAECLAQCDELDHELLCRCLEGAGQPVAAAQHAIKAAVRAAEQVAFDRAATLYQRALALEVHGPSEEGALREALGRALKHAGRSTEAAAQFRAAALRASGEHKLDLERCAAEELLATGDRAGKKLLASVCEAVGLPPLSVDADPRSVLASHQHLLSPEAVRRCRTQRPLTSLQRLRLAVAESTVRTSLGYLSSYAAPACAQYLVLAIDGGDDWHLAHALGTCAWIVAMGRWNETWTATLLDCMDEVVDLSGRADLIRFADVIHGIALYYQGTFQAARMRFARSEAAVRASTGFQDLVQFYDQACAFICGDFAHITRFTPAQVDDAHRRGRSWTVAMLTGCNGSVAYLTPDQPDAYARQLARARACYPVQRVWGWPHFLLLFGEVLLTLYIGEPERGFDLLETHRTSLRDGNVGSELMFALLRGNTAVACLSKHETSAPAERKTAWRRSASESIEAGGPRAYPGIEGSTHVMEAALSLYDGERAQAIARLRRAIRIFADRDLRMYEAAAQRRLGQLCSGSEGQALITAGERFMHAQQVKNLEAMTAMLCPGFRV